METARINDCTDDELKKEDGSGYPFHTRACKLPCTPGNIMEDFEIPPQTTKALS